MEENNMHRTLKSVLIAFLFLSLVGIGYTAAQRDVNGHGNATWGQTKQDVKASFMGKARAGAVTISESAYVLTVTYTKGRVYSKRFSFTGGQKLLFKITIKYSGKPQIVLNTLTKKYGNPSSISGTLYTWNFPSTNITYRRGSLQCQFIDANYIPGTKNEEQKLRRIKIGMTIIEVERIMGKPLRANVLQLGRRIYYYRTANIVFANNKVMSINRTKKTSIEDALKKKSVIIR